MGNYVVLNMYRFKDKQKMKIKKEINQHFRTYFKYYYNLICNLIYSTTTFYRTCNDLLFMKNKNTGVKKIIKIHSLSIK